MTYTVRLAIPIPGNTLRAVPGHYVLASSFRVLDANGRAVLGRIAAAPTSSSVAYPTGQARPAATARRLPTGSINLGQGRWYVGWKAPSNLRGMCRTVTVALDDGTTLRYLVTIT